MRSDWRRHCQARAPERSRDPETDRRRHCRRVHTHIYNIIY